jgi:hypothetical protein
MIHEAFKFLAWLAIAAVVVYTLMSLLTLGLQALDGDEDED